MSIIIERTKDDSKESETFREQLKSRSDEFAEQMLEQHFGALIGFIAHHARSTVTLQTHSVAHFVPFPGGLKMRKENWMQEIPRVCVKRRDGCPLSSRTSVQTGRSH